MLGTVGYLETSVSYAPPSFDLEGAGRRPAQTDVVTAAGRLGADWVPQARRIPRTPMGAAIDPPPWKWSDLGYSFDNKEDCKWQGSATSLAGR